MLYPSVYSISDRIPIEKFKAQRHSVATWVHNKEFVDKIITGEYDKITPLHIEVCSTYLCNFNCPWCSCRSSMARNKNEKNMSLPQLKHIIDECLKNSIGIQWTGGEPLINPAMILGIEYADKLGVNQCLFTNGSLLNEKIIDILLKTNLTFIRVSLNCVNEKCHSENHGYIDRNLSKEVLKNLKLLCNKKSKMRSNVQVGISLVVDELTIDDFENTISFINKLEKQNPKSVDYVVIRPVNLDICLINDLSDEFTVKYKKMINIETLEMLRASKVDIVLPNVEDSPFVCDGNCLGCNVFSEISPSGRMFMCSDKYGDLDYEIGNVFDDSIQDILNSKHRINILNNNKNCYRSKNCPHYSRGLYFNSIFNQIENYRKQGNMKLVLKWIEELRQLIEPSNHTFFI